MKLRAIHITSRTILVLVMSLYQLNGVSGTCGVYPTWPLEERLYALPQGGDFEGHLPLGRSVFEQPDLGVLSSTLSICTRGEFEPYNTGIYRHHHVSKLVIVYTDASLMVPTRTFGLSGCTNSAPGANDCAIFRTFGSDVQGQAKCNEAISKFGFHNPNSNQFGLLHEDFSFLRLDEVFLPVHQSRPSLRFWMAAEFNGTRLNQVSDIDTASYDSGLYLFISIGEKGVLQRTFKNLTIVVTPDMEDNVCSPGVGNWKRFTVPLDAIFGPDNLESLGIVPFLEGMHLSLRLESKNGFNSLVAIDDIELVGPETADFEPIDTNELITEKIDTEFFTYVDSQTKSPLKIFFWFIPVVFLTITPIVWYNVKHNRKSIFVQNLGKFFIAFSIASNLIFIYAFMEYVEYTEKEIAFNETTKRAAELFEEVISLNNTALAPGSVYEELRGIVPGTVSRLVLPFVTREQIKAIFNERVDVNTSVTPAYLECAVVGQDPEFCVKNVVVNSVTELAVAGSAYVIGAISLSILILIIHCCMAAQEKGLHCLNPCYKDKNPDDDFKWERREVKANKYCWFISLLFTLAMILTVFFYPVDRITTIALEKADNSNGYPLLDIQVEAKEENIVDDDDVGVLIDSSSLGTIEHCFNNESEAFEALSDLAFQLAQSTARWVQKDDLPCDYTNTKFDYSTLCIRIDCSGSLPLVTPESFIFYEAFSTVNLMYDVLIIDLMLCIIEFFVLLIVLEEFRRKYYVPHETTSVNEEKKISTAIETSDVKSKTETAHYQVGNHSL